MASTPLTPEEFISELLDFCQRQRKWYEETRTFTENFRGGSQNGFSTVEIKIRDWQEETANYLSDSHGKT